MTKGAMHFLVVPNDRMRGDEHKLKHMKSHPNLCGPKQCLASWGHQGGPRADSAAERPQMRSEAGRRDDCGCRRVYGAGMGEVGGAQGVMRHMGDWETVWEI